MVATLRPPRERVSPRAVRYWTARAAVRCTVLLAVEVGVLHFLADGPLLGWVGLVLAGTAALGVIYAAVMPRWSYRVHRWELAGDAVYTQTGWIDQERRVAPLSRIQTVDSARGPLEQLFGLANVTVTTASAAGPLRIHGLDRAVADELVARLTDASAAGTDDAT